MSMRPPPSEAVRPAFPATRRRAAPYADPYLAGVGLGLVLLAAYVLVGRGLGASGAFATVVATGVDAVAPARVAVNAAYAPYAGPGAPGLLRDWLVWEIVGVLIGGFASAALAGRIRWVAERGPRVREDARLATGFCGGAVMGIGAKIAHGCTSGQALTGGALLSVGSWIFIGACFAGAYATAPFVRRLWR